MVTGYEILIWAGFVLSIASIMIVSRKSMWLGLTLGAVVLGFTCTTPENFVLVVYLTLTDPSILFLALGVALIPIMGGALEEGGLMDDLVNNLRIGKKAFLVFSPGLLGMLPIPGGALLSCPLVNKAGEGVSGRRKAAINVWYRHVFVMLYPLASLLPTTKMAGINLYVGMVYLIPGAILFLILGYIFMLRGVKGKAVYQGRIKPADLFVSLGVFIVTPMLHFSLTYMFPFIYTEFHMVVAVSIGLALSFYVGGLGVNRLKPVIKKMKPWNFGLIILGMFLFLNVFQASEAPDLIAGVAMPKVVFLVIIGAVLGFVTGRLTAPIAIMVPIYFSRFGLKVLDPLTFAVIFLAVFLGYVVSPVHPCVSVSLEYFKVSYKEVMKVMGAPTLAALAVIFVFTFFVL